jgi:cytoskeletal protein CcmA (bactofilin family)
MASRPEEENSVYVGRGAELTGTIRARGRVVVDGAFEGEIDCDRLIVGPEGFVQGRIDAASAEIAGHVKAELKAEGLLSARATGRLEGEWSCGEIQVERGAVLAGSAIMVETAMEGRPLAGAAGFATAEAPIGPEEQEEFEEALDGEAVEEPPAAAAPPSLKRAGLRQMRRFPLRASRRSAG